MTAPRFFSFTAALFAAFALMQPALGQQTPAQKADTATAPAKNLKTKLPPGYTIPIVDISGETQRQVIVDREAGQYLGHPTTVLLEDDQTMLIVYPKGHGRGAIVYKRSADGGQDLERATADAEVVGDLARSAHAAPRRRRGGKKRIIMFSGLYPIRMAVTEDDGATWSELKPIGDFGGVVTMATVIGLKTPGHYLAFFHDDGRFIRGGERGALRDEGPAQRPHFSGRQALAVLGLHHALEGRRPHLECAGAHRHAARCEPVRAGRAPVARRKTDRRAAARELAEVQFLRHLLATTRG